MYLNLLLYLRLATTQRSYILLYSSENLLNPMVGVEIVIGVIPAEPIAHIGSTVIPHLISIVAEGKYFTLIFKIFSLMVHYLLLLEIFIMRHSSDLVLILIWLELFQQRSD